MNRSAVVTGNQADGSGKASSLYCFQCHTHVASASCGDGSHSLISLDAAVTTIRQNLTTTMDNVNDCIDKLRMLNADVSAFEEAHAQCKISVQSAARELIQKIHEHEARLLDELDIHRCIEYRRTGLDDRQRISDAENNLLNLQQLCRAMSEEVQSSDFLTQFNLQRENINRLVLDVTDVDNMVQKVSELRSIAFCPIRCNTAFGSLDICHGKQTNKRNGFTRKVSMSFSVSPARTVGSQSSSEQDSDPDEECACVSPRYPARSRKLSLQSGGVRSFDAPSSNSRKMSLHVSSSNPLWSTSARSTSPRPARDGKWSPQPSGKWSPQPSDTCSEEDEPLELLWAVNTEGAGVGQVNCPSDVCFLPDGTLVVSDRGNQRLQLFDTSGQPVKVIGEKLKPCRIHSNKNGYIVVSDSKDNNVCLYDKKGHCQSILGKKLFKSPALFKAPCGVATRSGKQFIVSDLERNDVKIFNNDGKVLKDLGKDSNECIEFKKPSYVTTDNDGRILVSDNLNHCVKVFDVKGQYLFQCVLGSKYPGSCNNDRDTSYLKYPNGVCCDAIGDIYVADWGSHTVSHFSRQGDFVSHVLTRDDGVYHPAGVAISGDRLAVCSYSDSHSSVQVFKMTS